MTLDIISLILNLVLGGSLIVTLVTLKATKASAEHKAEEAKAKASAAEIDNDRMVSQTVMEYIVEPLKKEINALRKDVRMFSRAIESISDCPDGDDCPVRCKLQGASTNDNNTGI